MAKQAKNPAMVLQELSVKKFLSPPEYEIIHSVTGSHENRFDYRVRVAGVEALGTGTSKQISKHVAAHNALLQLEAIGLYDPKENPVEEFKAAVIQKVSGSVPGPGSPLKSLNCIGPLKDICVENKIEDPVFTELSDVGPPHAREFTYECKIGSLRTVQTGNTKKMAKQLAAQEMLEKLKVVLPVLILEAPRSTEQKTLPQSDKDQKILEMYNKTFANIVIDKKVKVKNFALVFKQLIEESDKTLDSFLEDLAEKTEESLTRLLAKLELEYEIIRLQEEPLILVLSINCDVPFATMASSDNEEDAKAQLIEMTFQMLNCFLRLQS